MNTKRAWIAHLQLHRLVEARAIFKMRIMNTLYERDEFFIKLMVNLSSYLLTKEAFPDMIFSNQACFMAGELADC